LDASPLSENGKGKEGKSLLVRRDKISMSGGSLIEDASKIKLQKMESFNEN